MSKQEPGHAAPQTRPERIFDIHTHYLVIPDQDDEFRAFTDEWQLPFAVSCLGPDGEMLIDPTPEECIRANDYVLAEIEKRPHLVHGFCYVNPLHGQVAVKEMRRCIRDHGMPGLKLWIACKCSDPRCSPVIEEAIALGVPILQHTWIRDQEYVPGESYPADVAIAAARYPEARFLMAHIGFRAKEGVDAIADHPNVSVDTSGLDPELGCIEYAVRRLGAERVLYGSDAPGRDILCQIGIIAAASITTEEKEQIYYTNAQKLLKGGNAK